MKALMLRETIIDVSEDFEDDGQGGYAGCGGHHNVDSDFRIVELTACPAPEEFRATFWQWELVGTEIKRKA